MPDREKPILFNTDMVKAILDGRKKVTRRVVKPSPGGALKIIEEAPAADVEPGRHGRWKKSYSDHEAFGVRPFFRYCSECHEATVHQYNYCPNCGAKMDKEGSDA